MRTAVQGLALFLCFLTGLPAVAQTTEPVEDFKPSSLNQPGKQYPQVNSERRVRVRVVAIDGRSVTSAISRFFWLTSSCWRFASIP